MAPAGRNILQTLLCLCFGIIILFNIY